MTHEIIQVLWTLKHQNNDVGNVCVGLISVKSFKPAKVTVLLALPFHKGQEYIDAFRTLQDFSKGNLLIVVAFTHY